MQLTSEQERFKDAYIKARGYWVEFNDGLLIHSPEWLQTYLKYAETPALVGPLEPKLREMIYVATDASTTHMFTEGLEIHINLAFQAGCTVSQLIEVMQLATMQGLDSVANGMTILIEESRKAGVSLQNHQNSEDDLTSKMLNDYRKVFGDCPAWLETLACLAPEYTRALINVFTISEEHSSLSDKEKVLIRLALAASPTHLNQDGLRTEIQRALALKIPTDEIIEVFQLVAHLGIHACVDGVPAIVRAFQEHQS